MRRLAPIALLALIAAGCGDQRTRPPDVEHPDAPTRFEAVTLDGTGVRLTRPVNWIALAPHPPLEGGARSKTATVAVWRYPRTEPLPRTDAALEEAKTRLLDRVRQRNPTFVLRTSQVTRIAGARAIQLTGRETVAGFDYDVRSAHLFKAGAEIVVDAYAPPEDFPRVDATVFQPVLERLEVTAP
ncbi:MAG: hypothetical protein QOI80_2974 [Solirubrobacteraceae bacterium]|nr:hypothetical protein [Solirubrobacteraceae bacterium]